MNSRRTRVSRTLLVIAVISIATLLGFSIVPAWNSAFSIAATTDVIVIEPSCRDLLTWDLPRGWVVADNAPLEASDPLATSAAPVTVELAAGGRATVIREAGGFWKMRLTNDSAYRDCAPAPPSAISVTVGGVRLPADPDGYSYQSTYGEDSGSTARSATDTERPLLGSAPPLALRLAGRMVLGQPMSEGGGWGGAGQPILHRARVEVRDKAWLTNQSLSVLVEEIGSGSLVDTHACIAAEAAGQGSECAFRQSGPSAGFVYYPTSDGTMFAQVHRTASRIGVVPYSGVERKLGVTNWSILVKSPLLQSVVAALLLISALIQGWVAFGDVWPRMAARRNAARVNDGADLP